jgi:uncharacterized protein (TIGR02996 family)
MTTEIELLRAIAANPDEDTPRLMYADWLDERHAPETAGAAKAEFIRLQIRLARQGEQMTREERALLEKQKWRLHDNHRHEWEKPLHTALGYTKMTADYERGLLNGLVVANPDRLIASQLLYASTSTIRHLTVEPVSDEQVLTLASQLAATRIDSLHLRSSATHSLTDAGVECVAALKNVRSLILDSDRITATGAARIAERMSDLQELLIDGNPIGDEGARRIATMSHLRRLGLNGCGITEAGAAAIAASTTLPLVAKVMGLETAGFPDVAAALTSAVEQGGLTGMSAHTLAQARAFGQCQISGVSSTEPSGQVTVRAPGHTPDRPSSERSGR